MFSSDDVHAAIDLRFAVLGLPRDEEQALSHRLVGPVLDRTRELRRLNPDRLCAADGRVQAFLDRYLADVDVDVSLPRTTLVLDQPGLARTLSLPKDGNEFHSSLLDSYRLSNGVLHNPANDRRTTKGAFHVAEGGLPIADDKIAVAKDVYARLLHSALNPPSEFMELPYTANNDEHAATFVSLYQRPVVVPEVPGVTSMMSLETRFVVPGGMVCNLDFVEGIFGNAGDPLLPENDAALDADGWTGHTGYVVLAPHLVKLTKKELGLPHVDDATERQRRDGQCWSSEDERYNDGLAFKATARDEHGVMVTVIADNYFGYCKKEIKTQISFSANLLGCAEEEHAGGAICHPAWNLTDRFVDETPQEFTLDDVLARDPERFVRQEQGHAVDTMLDRVVLVPSGAAFNLKSRQVSWENGQGGFASIPLEADTDYLSPNGYRVYAKHRELDPTQWHLVGVLPRATQCHKPATVSGGGKSEISKSIMNAFVFGNAYAHDFDADMDHVAELLDRDYSQRFADPALNGTDTRPVLDPARSQGSVIKLFTPSSRYTAEYNEFLLSLPPHITELVFLVKRHHRAEWGDDWRSHFSVGVMNGRKGNLVRLDEDKVIVNMLRVGFHADGSWRLFSLRGDFSPSVKVQTEDDITASTVAPRPDGGPSRKYVTNCESLLFQRPDDAIHRGFDKQTEMDMTDPETFISNFEPLTSKQAAELVDDMVEFSRFTAPMQELLREAAASEGSAPFVVSSAHPRLVGGKPSRNPRYLQTRPDLMDPRGTALADLMSHLYHRVPTDQFLPLPVDVVAAGRRNNPPEDGVPPLCAYNPLHWMELPELFMEYISSMTGKSPSTTGAGSEGAMTKGPFNALQTVADLNTALLAYALTDDDGWLSSAGYVGPQVKVDHDISMLIPELFSRMTPQERDAATLSREGYLERIQDFEHQGRLVRASRLGHRINEHFVTAYFGRIFQHPTMVFTEEMLKPELQGMDVFAESVDVIVTTHERVARAYIADGSIADAVPPLRGLLEIMADGSTAEGWTLDSPEFRHQFTREAVLASDWYTERLQAKVAVMRHRWRRAADALQGWVDDASAASVVAELGLTDRLEQALAQVERLQGDAVVEGLVGTTGAEPALLLRAEDARA